MKGIRSMIIFLLFLFAAASVWGGEHITLQTARGDVSIRAGVTETWAKANPGDTLNPDATLRTGKKSQAVILLPVANKRISLQPEVILDISDIRDLTQEELMQKLTMAKVRASSYQWKNKELNIPNTAVTHGDNKAQTEALTEENPETGIQELNGTRVLYDNGFYSTSALKAMEVLRRYPALGNKFEYRVIVPQALEKANLRSEALNEYVSLSMSQNISKDQKDLLQAKIAQLKRE